jgi:hypothetical protein
MAEIHILTRDGVQIADVPSAEDRSEVASYFNAIRDFRETGDASGLDRFNGMTIETSKGTVPIITDPGLLAELEDAGELDIDDLYI